MERSKERLGSECPAAPAGGLQPAPRRVPDALRGVGLAAAGFVAITYVVMGSYNPFIYFNF